MKSVINICARCMQIGKTKRKIMDPAKNSELEEDLLCTSSFLMLSWLRRFSILPIKKNTSPVCWLTIQHKPYAMFLMSVSGQSQSTSCRVRSGPKNPMEYAKKDHIIITTMPCQIAYAIRQAFGGRCFDLMMLLTGSNHWPAKKKYQRSNGFNNAVLSGFVVSSGIST